LNPTWANVGFGIGPSGKAVRTGKRQLAQPSQHLGSTSDAQGGSAETQLGMAALMALPLIDGGKVLGNLSIYSKEPQSFDQQEITMLQELADDLAFGISTLRTRREHRKSIEEQQQYLDKIRTTLEATIQAIAATVEMRDPYTAGHEHRVAELAVAIAQEMGLSDHQIEGIRVAATVHDLGKIQIPAEILSKPRSLTDLEFSFIKNHPLMGYHILKDIDFPWPIAEIVLQHHERIDGSGYPNGLKGKRILLEAKIVAVADTVEAMASHRPYRAGLGIGAALDEITAGSGQQYDPKVVEACLRLFREKGFSLVD
jgi:putative nucleotidyltransferase with HDIG domain